jgi:hypothetical protein
MAWTSNVIFILRETDIAASHHWVRHSSDSSKKSWKQMS